MILSLINDAKIGIIASSLIAGVLGFFVLKAFLSKENAKNTESEEI
jgi:Na+/H+ antiporter NhaA